MFKEFKNKYKLTDVNRRLSNVQLHIDGLSNEFFNVVDELGGSTFENGLYRVLSQDEIEKYTSQLCEMFPVYKGKIVCFAYDWLGRFYAVNKNLKNCDLIYMLEPGVGEILELDSDIVNFHNRILVDDGDEVLARSFYDSWRKKNSSTIKRSQCVGYKIPLFLSGKDNIDNLQLQDLDVYLDINSQLLNKIKNLPSGTKINKINIEP